MRSHLPVPDSRRPTARALAMALSLIFAADLARATPTGVADPASHFAYQQQALDDEIARTREQWGAAHPHAATAASSTASPLSLSNCVMLTTNLVVAQAGSYPIMQFSFKASPAGLSSILFYFTAPKGPYFVGTQFTPQAGQQTGTVTFGAVSLTLPPFSPSGKWALSRVLLLDNNGSSKVLDAQDLAALFTQPYVMVSNPGVSDIMPPVIHSGRILTPNVSLSAAFPQFRASVTVSDDVSGADSVAVVIQPPNSASSQSTSQTQGLPLKTGVLTAYDDIDQSQPTGSWSIVEYEVCDLAENCVVDTSPQDIADLFGTTQFNVTP